MSYELSVRKQAILKAIIDLYIESGEPVGSKTLTQSDRFDLSSATLRNEMAELEALGYLEQPHTSAGRIPTELGYRFYVDSLMQEYALNSGELAEMNAMLKAKTAELDKLLQNAGRVMASLTNYTAIAVKQPTGGNVVSRFSVTYIDEHNFLLVMVCGDRSALTRFVRTEMSVDENVTASLERALNSFIAGKDLSQITLPYLMQVESCMGAYGGLISPIMKFIYDAVGQTGEQDVRIDGVDKLLEYPEFLDSGKLKEVLGMFDRKSELLGILDGGEDDVTICIGRENGVEALAGSSLVYKKIVVNGKVVGAVGVIGPCRMDYSKVVSAIRYLSGGIENAMSPPPDSKMLPSQTPPGVPGKEGASSPPKDNSQRKDDE